jgi:hypothetical protein
MVDDETSQRRMFKMADQRGRSQRRGESHSFPYVEPLSAARTKLADFFNILLVVITDKDRLSDDQGWDEAAFAA